MTANENSPKTNPRLERIRTVSQIAKWIVRLFLLCAIAFFFLSILSSPLQQDFTLRGLFMFGYQIILCVWYWKLSQLFRLYERGQIFDGKTIRCIKKLGTIWIAGWLLMTALHFSPKPAPIVRAPLPPNVHIIVGQSEHRYRFGFLSFDFGTGINFGQLLGGIVILLGAWIMDEGRKIQEEQELTV